MLSDKLSRQLEKGLPDRWLAASLAPDVWSLSNCNSVVGREFINFMLLVTRAAGYAARHTEIAATQKIN